MYQRLRVKVKVILKIKVNLKARFLKLKILYEVKLMRTYLSLFILIKSSGYLKSQSTFDIDFTRPEHQDAADKYETGVRKYVGPVRIALQELDGQFFHNFQVEFVPVFFLSVTQHL